MLLLNKFKWIETFITRHRRKGHLEVAYSQDIKIETTLIETEKKVSKRLCGCWQIKKKSPVLQNHHYSIFSPVDFRLYSFSTSHAFYHKKSMQQNPIY